MLFHLLCLWTTNSHTTPKEKKINNPSLSFKFCLCEFVLWILQEQTLFWCLGLWVWVLWLILLCFSFNPEALALLRCWISALSSMVKSCRPRDFVTKSSTLELLPPCWAAKKRPWGSAAPCQSKMLDLKVTLSCKAQEIKFHTGKSKEKEQGNYGVWVFSKLFSHVVFSKYYSF